MTSVLDLDPIGRAACAVGTVPALRHKTLKPEIAGLPKQFRADLALFELANENPLRPPCQQARQVVLSKVQRQFPQIVAIQRQDIERVELNLVIMPAGVQTVEIGDAVDAQQHRLAIDDERSRSVLQRGLDDQRITISPVVSVAGAEP